MALSRTGRLAQSLEMIRSRAVDAFVSWESARTAARRPGLTHLPRLGEQGQFKRLAVVDGHESESPTRFPQPWNLPAAPLTTAAHRRHATGATNTSSDMSTRSFSQRPSSPGGDTALTPSRHHRCPIAPPIKRTVGHASQRLDTWLQPGRARGQYWVASMCDGGGCMHAPTEGDRSMYHLAHRRAQGVEDPRRGEVECRNGEQP